MQLQGRPGHWKGGLQHCPPAFPGVAVSNIQSCCSSPAELVLEIAEPAVQVTKPARNATHRFFLSKLDRPNAS